MTIKVTFLNPDQVLAAVVRALAVKAAGFPAAGGMSDAQLIQQGFYSFEFSPRQFERFKQYVENYIADDFRKLIRISNSDT